MESGLIIGGVILGLLLQYLLIRTAVLGALEEHEKRRLDRAAGGDRPFQPRLTPEQRHRVGTSKVWDGDAWVERIDP